MKGLPRLRTRRKLSLLESISLGEAAKVLGLSLKRFIGLPQECDRPQSNTRDDVR